jgi:chromosome partitioning protein
MGACVRAVRFVSRGRQCFGAPRGLDTVVITVIGNLKGGSGKSTVTFNLAAWLAVRGESVVAFDLDPQATLSDVTDVRREEGYQPTVEVLQAVTEIAPQLLRSNGEILVDVGASNVVGMREALSVADRVLIPVPPSQADIWSTQRFLMIVQESVSPQKHPKVYAFVNRADTHHAVRESDEAEAALAELPGVDLLTSRLCQRTIYRRSFSEGLAVFELEPNGKGAQEFDRLAGVLYPQLTA